MPRPRASTGVLSALQTPGTIDGTQPVRKRSTMGNIGTWQLVIVLAIVLLLFGAKRLPEAARGLGRSLKIFKSETQGLVSGDDKADDLTGESDAPQPQQQAPQEAQPKQAPRAVESTTPAAKPQSGEPVNDQTRHDS